MPDSIRDLLAQASAQLNSSTTPDLDAEVLLQRCLNKDRAWLIANHQLPVEPALQDEFWALVQRRQRGEPVAYLTGYREFWSLQLQVNSAVLVPRPETELLVEHALALIEQGMRILDLGTGSGAIALAIASERPECLITATDCDAAALALAKHNADTLGITNVEFMAGDWYQAVTEKFDLIVSNPPYVADHDPHLQQDGLKFEPPNALRAGPDGLRELKRIITDVHEYLKPSGWCLLEHGAEQAQAVATMLNTNGFKNIRHSTDLSGLVRLTKAQLRSA